MPPDHRLQRPCKLMSLCLYCPNCRASELAITHVVRFRSRHAGQGWIQALRCEACGFLAAGRYDEGTTRGTTCDGKHVAARISRDTYSRLAAALDGCPAPRSITCPCPAHVWFRENADRSEPVTLGSVPTIGAPFAPSWHEPEVSESGAPAADPGLRCA